MKKGAGIATLILMIAALAGSIYLVLNGIGENGAGSAASTKLGLDLAGGVSITYQAVGDEDPTEEAMEDTIAKLRQRIDQYSTEAQVYPEGGNRISIEIPGVTDANAILEDLGSPGSLYFIRALAPDGTLNYQLMTTASGSQVYKEDKNLFVYDGSVAYLYDKDTDEIMTGSDGLPIAYEIQNKAKVRAMYELTRDISEIIADGSAVLSGTDVVSAEGVARQDDFGAVQYIVSLSFTDPASLIFAEETGAVAGKPGLYGTIAIYYDREILSVPAVNSRIDGGNAQITGMQDINQAQELAQNIRIGGLSLELEELRSNVVGAQLGSDAIRTSLLAGIIGIAFLIVFIIAVYRLPGVASSIALVLYSMLVILMINLFELTLTLPGIAGIILSIGMAVDANVIIFARIREEIADGMTVQSAIKAGFEKALSAIIDGNITTLIAAVVLMIMGSGTIKGFAYTLALGIVLSMFTALVITKLLVKAFYAIGFKDAKYYGVAKGNKRLPIVKNKKIFFGISIGIIAVGIIAMIGFGAATGDPLNYSLEFKGGTATTISFSSELSREQIEAEVIPIFEGVTKDANVQWQTVNDSAAVVVKTRTLEQEEREALNQQIESKFGIAEDQISMESIGSTISGEMRKEALTAVMVAAVCMLIYIWFRFSDIRFGVSAVVALIHDVMVVLTFYALVRLSVGSTFIACMLTIVGYSINATIVIFDRIRENLQMMKKRDTIQDVVDRSITQTLSRSIFTSLTTAIMVVMLLILGVSSIREFALPLLIGIISGTYSSICVTGALWYVLREKFPPAPDEE